MTKRSKTAAALAASLALFGAFPDAPLSCPPLRAVAEAEAEIPRPAVEADLGTPLPLSVCSELFTEPGETWQRHRPEIRLGDQAGEYQALEQALTEYNEASSLEAVNREGHPVIKSLYVHRADSLAVSFAESCAMYGGGMRGRYAVLGRNFDAVTGAPLTWQDVFAGRAIVANELALLLHRNYPNEAFAQQGLPELTAKVRSLLDEGHCSWTLDPGGATFYFNVHSLSGDPYAPIYTATLTFDVNGFCFREKYRHAPLRWCMEIEPRMPMRVFPGDSVLNTTEIRSDAEGLRIIRGGPAATARDGIYDKAETVFTDPGRFNGIRPVLVKLEDGRKYLYVDCRLAPAPEDYEKGYDPQYMAVLENRHEIRVYDLSGDEIRRVPCDGRFTMLATNPLDTEHQRWHVMTDPDSFLLQAADLPLSEGLRRCRVSENGALEVTGAVRNQDGTM